MASNKPVYDTAHESHEILAYIMLVLVVGHVGAVIKHLIVDKENLLRRLWWGKS